MAGNKITSVTNYELLEVSRSFWATPDLKHDLGRGPGLLNLGLSLAFSLASGLLLSFWLLLEFFSGLLGCFDLFKHLLLGLILRSWASGLPSTLLLNFWAGSWAFLWTSGLAPGPAPGPALGLLLGLCLLLGF